MSITIDLRKYLGISIFYGCTHKYMFAPLFQRMNVALLGWKTSLLSLLSIITLGKSVLNALPNYIMQSFYLPWAVYDLLNKKICDFI